DRPPLTASRLVSNKQREGGAWRTNGEDDRRKASWNAGSTTRTPVVRFDSALSSSEADNGAFLTTGDRLDLLAIKPRDFEKIVHKWAAAYYGHAVLTPASRDGGIDVLATAKNDL